MNITAEATIDLDEKRRVWSTTTAEMDEIPQDPEEQVRLLTNLSIAAANGAIQAYEQAKERRKPQTFKEDKAAQTVAAAARSFRE